MQGNFIQPSLFDKPIHQSTSKCEGCGEIKPLSEFPRKRRRSRYCNSCHNKTEKQCVDCKTIKPIEKFNWNYGRNKTTLRDAICGACRARRTREWNAKYKETKVLHRNLVATFGITLEDFNAMLVLQNGVCAICGNPPQNTNGRNWRLNVDHCHACGEVRMLLCSTCNNGLGCFKDNPELLLKAIGYLSKHTHIDTNT